MESWAKDCMILFPSPGGHASAVAIQGYTDGEDILAVMVAHPHRCHVSGWHRLVVERGKDLVREVCDGCK